MHDNRVRELRKKKGLTQKALAQLAQTSQQQIQRIEGGGQSVRFDLAVTICNALEAKMKDVFPATELPLKRAKGRIKSAADVYMNPKIASDFESAGIDTDPTQWTLKIRLRGGFEGFLPISGREKSRLWKLVQGDEDDGFIVFDSGSRRYAINPKHLLFCQFLFDPVWGEKRDDEEDDAVHFFLADSPKPMSFHAEPDRSSIEDEDANDGDAQLQDLFFYAEMGTEQRLRFEDIDGEVAIFRIADVVMFSVCLEDVTPSMFDPEEPDDCEEHGSPA